MNRWTILALSLSVVFAQAQDQAPDAHDGQPSYCVNHSGYDDYPMVEPHVCACQRSCREGEPEDTKCLTYCQRPRCKCIHECDLPPTEIAHAH